MATNYKRNPYPNRYRDDVYTDYNYVGGVYPDMDRPNIDPTMLLDLYDPIQAFSNRERIDPKAVDGRSFFQKANDAIASGKNKLKGWAAKNGMGWSKGSGIKAFGKNVGKWGTIAGGALQGIEALQGIDALSKTSNTTEDLLNEISTSYATNPMAGSYLTSEQKALLNKIRRGDIDSDVQFDDFMPNDLGDLGGIVKDAGLGLLVGGIPGAIVGGVGGAVNSGLSGANEEQARQNAELEALLQALQDAELDYQSMLRSGVRRRYENMYM